MLVRRFCSITLSLAFACLCLRFSFADMTEPSEPIVSPEAQLSAKAIQVPDGFSLTTVASEPHVANGVAFCFDPAGHIFVAETYRVGKGIEDNRGHLDWLDDDLASRTVADRRAYLK